MKETFIASGNRQSSDLIISIFDRIFFWTIAKNTNLIFDQDFDFLTKKEVLFFYVKY